MNNNNNIGWLFFGGYKNILPSILTILPSSSTRAILLTSLAIYSCIPLKAIQYYIIICICVYNWSITYFPESCDIWTLKGNILTNLNVQLVSLNVATPYRNPLISFLSVVGLTVLRIRLELRGEYGGLWWAAPSIEAFHPSHQRLQQHELYIQQM